ncbi:MAG: hypothetical protein RsTaC01_0784 [Candidatus Paraimprobicoccus trichonymphae]|uniref:Uncharacterized protein n=1 Tax=Candidatus Paraimprobicoccus trichonymphae TaxID=3033793 RepID=A0AA48HWX5_9FIRM|nr:MAG: hypothetical protein RsTaC01_0784 [Candidatus Paraimprobicoccus trichonymphae]
MVDFVEKSGDIYFKTYVFDNFCSFYNYFINKKFKEIIAQRLYSEIDKNAAEMLSNVERDNDKFIAKLKNTVKNYIKSDSNSQKILTTIKTLNEYSGFNVIKNEIKRKNKFFLIKLKQQKK